MTSLTICMVNARVKPCGDLYHPDQDVMACWTQLETRPGLYALLADWVVRQDLRQWEVARLLRFKFHDQLIQMRLPKLAGLAGLLDRLRFDVLTSEDLYRFRCWLQGISEIPAVLRHMPEVPFDYLCELMREPMIEVLPVALVRNARQAGKESMDELVQVLQQYWGRSLEMGNAEATVRKRLRRMESLEQLKLVDNVLAHSYWAFTMRRDGVQVPMPLAPAGNVMAPRTLPEFERLGALQQNCVDQYYRRALLGSCAIYCVRDGKNIMLTAELVKSEDGFWLPKQVLARCNTLPYTRHARELLHWLAMAQVDERGHRTYYRNLMRLMQSLSSRILAGDPEDAWVEHWASLANAAVGLLNERVNAGYAEQKALPLGDAENPVVLEKQRRKQRRKRLQAQELPVADGGSLRGTHP